MCNNMAGSWGYHAKWSKSDKGQEPYDFTHMWDMKQKATIKPKKQTNSQTQTTVWWLLGEAGKEDKGDQI